MASFRTKISNMRILVIGLIVLVVLVLQTFYTITTQPSSSTSTSISESMVLHHTLQNLQHLVHEILGQRHFQASTPDSIQSSTDMTPYINRDRLRRNGVHDKDDVLPIHYKPTRFELSPDRPLYATMNDYKFRPITFDKSTQDTAWIDLWNRAEKQEVSLSSPSDILKHTKCTKEQITLTCHVDRTYRNISSWQHYMHLLFPCWSIIRRFEEHDDVRLNVKSSSFINLDPERHHYPPTKDKKSIPWQDWSLNQNKYYQKYGIKFLSVPFQEKSFFFKQRERDIKEKKSVGDGTNDNCHWMVHTGLNFNGLGFQHPDGKSPFENSYYFMNPQDIHDFQRIVLGKSYQPGPSLMNPNYHLDQKASNVGTDSNYFQHLSELKKPEKFTISILNRHFKKSEKRKREWYYGIDTYNQLREEYGDILNVEYIPGYDDYTFEEQAKHFHSVDVVISPHGAQLSNSVFLRPCTVVLELLPPSFYHPRKLTLAMEAGGIGYYGYPHSGSPIADTPDHDSETGAALGTKNGWRGVRDVKWILASTESIVYAIPELIQSGLSCRYEWAATHKY